MGKKILIVLGILLLLIVVGLFSIPSLINWNAQKDFIESTAKSKSGYDLQLNGDLSLSLFPYPYLSVADVVLNNEGQTLMKMGEANVSLQLFPLFSGEVVVDTIRLEKPEIYFTILDNNNTNWGPYSSSKEGDKSSFSFGAGTNKQTSIQEQENLPKEKTAIQQKDEAEHASKSEENGVFSLKKIIIEDGRFVFEDKRSAEKHEISGFYTSLDGESMRGPYDLESKLNWQGHDMVLSFHSGRISKNEETFPLKLSLKMPESGAEFSYSGVVASSMPLDIQGELSLKADNIGKALSVFNVKAGDLSDQSFSSSALLTLSGDEKITLDNLRLGLGPLAWKGKFSAVQNNKIVGNLFLDNVSTYKGKVGKDFNLIHFLSDINAKGDFVLDGQDLDLNAITLTKTEQEILLSAQYKLFEKALRIKNLSAKGLAGNTNMLVKGAIKNVSALDGIDLELNATSDDLNALLDFYGMETSYFKEPVKNLSVKSKVTGNKKAVNFDTSLNIIDAAVRASGVIKNPFESREFGALNLSVTHPDFVDLVRYFSPDFNPGNAWEKQFSLNTKIKQVDQEIHLNDLTGRIGNASVDADLLANVAGTRPEISGEVVLGDFVMPNSTSTSSVKKDQKTSAAKKESSTNKSTSNVRWSREAINTEWMKTANLDLKLKAKSFSYNLWQIDNLSAALKMRNGSLSVKDFTGDLYGGQVKGDIILSAGKADHDPLSVDLKADVKTILLEKVITAILKKKNETVKGPVSGFVDVKAIGLSPAALISDLQGRGTLSGQTIKISGIDLNEVAHALRADTKLKDSFEDIAQIGKGNTEFDSVSGTYTIEEGVIKTTDLTFDEKRVQMLTKGKIDLPRWVVDLVNTVSFKNNKEAPDFDIKISGSLDNPASTFADEIIKGFIQRKLERKIQKEFDNLLSKKLNEKLNKKSNDAANDNSKDSSNNSKKIEPEDLFKSLLKDAIK